MTYCVECPACLLALLWHGHYCPKHKHMKGAARGRRMPKWRAAR